MTDPDVLYARLDELNGAVKKIITGLRAMSATLIQNPSTEDGNILARNGFILHGLAEEIENILYSSQAAKAMKDFSKDGVTYTICADLCVNFMDVKQPDLKKALMDKAELVVDSLIAEASDHLWADSADSL